MKKSHKISAALIASVMIFFTGCHDPIFHEVRNDVKPEEPTVSGIINCITRFTKDNTEYLIIVAEDGLKYKAKDDEKHGKWKAYKAPVSAMKYSYDASGYNGQQIVKVCADSNNLYLVTAEYSTDSSSTSTNPTKYHLWAQNLSSDEWNEIAASEINFNPGALNILQTNAPKKEHRACFIGSLINSNYKYFKLNGSEAPVEFEIMKLEDSDTLNLTTKSVNSVIWFDGECKFFSSAVSTTNETYEDDPTFAYYATDKKLYWKNTEGSYTNAGFETTYKISNLAVCADSILIGMGNTDGSTLNGGITRALLSNGVPADKTTAFDTNASFQISHYYIVLAILNATPEKSEADSSLYASITFTSSSSGSYDKIGLWSYYPDRKNWNRE